MRYIGLKEMVLTIHRLLYMDGINELSYGIFTVSTRSNVIIFELEDEIYCINTRTLQGIRKEVTLGEKIDKYIVDLYNKLNYGGTKNENQRI